MMLFAQAAGKVTAGQLIRQPRPRWQNPRTRALVDAVYQCL